MLLKWRGVGRLLVCLRSQYPYLMVLRESVGWPLGVLLVKTQMRACNCKLLHHLLTNHLVQEVETLFPWCCQGIFASCYRLEASPTLRISVKDALCWDSLMENLEGPDW